MLKLSNSKKSITIRYPDLARTIISPVAVSIPGQANHQAMIGIWDTGATGCAITKHFADLMGLQPIGRTVVKGVHGDQETNVFLLEITINGITFTETVTECEALSGNTDYGLLIGMSVISQGEMAISNLDGKTVMTFRIPPTKEVCFVREDNAREKHQPKKR